MPPTEEEPPKESSDLPADESDLSASDGTPYSEPYEQDAGGDDDEADWDEQAATTQDVRPYAPDRNTPKDHRAMPDLSELFYRFLTNRKTEDGHSVEEDDFIP